MWRRLPTMPRKFHRYPLGSPRSDYIKKCTTDRYFETPDGLYLADVCKNLKRELGVVDSVRFIET